MATKKKKAEAERPLWDRRDIVAGDERVGELREMTLSCVDSIVGGFRSRERPYVELERTLDELIGYVAAVASGSWPPKEESPSP
jgi:hypothetical protein